MMGHEKTGIAVIDPHPMFRKGLAHHICRNRNFDVVAEGACIMDAAKWQHREDVDVVLLEVCGVPEPANSIAELRQQLPHAKVLVVTSSSEEDDVVDALTAGAAGYVLKDVDCDEFLRALDAVIQGGTYVTPRLAVSLLKQGPQRMAAAQKAKAADDPGLTRREEEVAQEVARGRSNKEVARTLKLSEKTVKHHMTTIMSKLQVRNRVEVAVAARTLMKV